MLDTARVEAHATRFSVVLVWDGKSTGEGPGGTSDFARRADRANARLKIIDPLAP